MRYTAFLSHSHADRQIAEQLKGALTLVGVTLYLAEHDIQAGSYLAQKIQRAIDAAHVVVVLLTDDGYSAPYVQQEIGYASKARKIIIPLVAPSVPAADALAMLDGIEYLPFDPSSPDAGLRDLVVRLQGLAARNRQVDVLVGLSIAAFILLAISQE